MGGREERANSNVLQIAEIKARTAMLEQKSDNEPTWPIHHWGIGSDMFV